MYQSERLLNVPGHRVEMIGRRALNVDGVFCRDEHEAARLIQLIDLFENLPKLCQVCGQPTGRPTAAAFTLAGKELCAECYEAEHMEIGGGA